MKGFPRNRRVRFLFLPGDLQLGDWLSQQDFDLYSRGFLIPHPGVLISVFGLAVIFLSSPKVYVFSGEVLTLSVVQEWSNGANQFVIVF